MLDIAHLLRRFKPEALPVKASLDSVLKFQNIYKLSSGDIIINQKIAIISTKNGILLN